MDTVNLMEDISAKLSSKFPTIIPLNSLEDLDHESFIVGSTVVSLLDIDSPMLKHLTSMGLKSLQLIFGESKNILWVTRGSNDKDPYANASIGLLRAITSELPHLRVQTLDFDSAEKFDAHLVAECIMRLEITGPWEREPSLKDHLLWTTEPELSYRNGKLFIQRVLQHRLNNDRLNSQRRTINCQNQESIPVEIYQRGTSGDWAIRQKPSQIILPSTAINTDRVTISLIYSSLWAIKLFGGTNLFIGIGHDVKTKDLVMALTTERCSVIETRPDWTISLTREAQVQPGFLQVAINELLANWIIALLPNHGTLLAHEPSVSLASALTRRAAPRGITVKFTTGRESQGGNDWIYLHRRAARRLIKQKIPQKTSIFVDFTSSSEDSGALVSSCLPPNCKSEGFSSLFQKTAAIRSNTSLDDIGISFRRTVSELQSLENALSTSPDASSHPIPLGEIQDGSTVTEQLSLIDWTRSSEASLEIAQLQPEAMFLRNRTYLLVGLTGDTGKSLCRWMARNGAGTIVLTSRSPDVDQRWIDELSAAGTAVKVVAM